MTARQDLTHKERIHIQGFLVHMAALTFHRADFRTMRSLLEWAKTEWGEDGTLLAFAADVDPVWFQKQVVSALNYQWPRKPFTGLHVVK